MPNVVTGINIGLRRDRQILHPLSISIEEGDRWVVIGPNGSGKTSLSRIFALREHPSFGSMSIFGAPIGTFDYRLVRPRIGFVSSAFAALIRPGVRAQDVVMTALNDALEPWWHRYSDEDYDRARHALERLGLTHLAHREFGQLSTGEQQRVILARALVTEPRFMILDEPFAGLDLVGREQLRATLDALPHDLTSLVVVHHLEEIPSSTTHALLLNRGRTVVVGSQDLISSESVTEAFDYPVEVTRSAGRISGCVASSALSPSWRR